MKKVLFLLLFVSSLFALDDNLNTDLNISQEKINKEKLLKEELRRQEIRKDKIASYLRELNRLEQEISKEQVWMKSYSSYLTSLEVRDSLSTMRERIAYLKKNGDSAEAKDELSSLVSKERILVTQVNQLKEKDSALFSQLLHLLI